MTVDAMHDELIGFKRVTLRIRDRHLLAETDWRIREGQNWVVIGPNGSGKTTLLRALTGHTPVVGGTIRRRDPKAHPGAIGYVSFEQQQQLIAREQERDAARFFSRRFDDQLTAGRMIRSARAGRTVQDRAFVSRIVQSLGFEHLLDRPLRVLSNGECRKILIACAVLRSKGLLVLDEPFEGLDAGGRQRLAASIGALVKGGIQIIMATHRLDCILPEFSHVLGLKDGRLFFRGTRTEVLTAERLADLYDAQRVGSRAAADVPAGSNTAPAADRPSLIRMRDVTVRYGSRTVFSHLTWTVRPGQHWAVTGPNGSGKTTLLQMITGDHPQAYANEIYLFGRRRGSGESIWDIKQRVGLMSSEFQLNYRKSIGALDVVLSGFFDSVGLYRHATRQQRTAAQQWMARLDLTPLQQRRFDQLSYGERRMILLARAMVKAPELLVLDEPCQGLDPTNRRIILTRIDAVAREAAAQILYVTHVLKELPACITHRLDLTKFSPQPP